MKVERYILGDLQANCYLIWQDLHVVIVDPGSSSKKLVEHIKSQNGIVDAILLTHAHCDHVAGVESFVKQFSCPVYISAEDEKMLRDSKLNCSSMFQKGQSFLWPVTYYDAFVDVGKFHFFVEAAPGHTNGSVLLIFDNFICSGDVLFKQSIGRCDLPMGSSAKMSQTLNKIKTLNSDYIVYPGHGEATSIQEELVNNPYL